MDSTITLAPGIWSWTWRSRILKKTERLRDTYIQDIETSLAEKQVSCVQTISGTEQQERLQSFTASILYDEFYLKAAPVKAKLWWTPAKFNQSIQEKSCQLLLLKWVNSLSTLAKRLWTASSSLQPLSKDRSANTLRWICWVLVPKVQHHLFGWDIRLFKTTISSSAF